MPLLSLGHGTHKSNQSSESNFLSSSQAGTAGGIGGQARKKLRPWSQRPSPKGPRTKDTKDDIAEQAGEEQLFVSDLPSTEPQCDASSDSILANARPDLVPELWPCPKPDNLPSITNAPPSYHITYHFTSKVGPRFYANCHLRAPDHSAYRAIQSPQAAFSSQFPPIPALPPGSPPLRTLTLNRASIFNILPNNDSVSSPGQRKDSSESALPTSDSSQGDITGSRPTLGNKFASASLAALVDSLDASNPYGQMFHHDSPYDLGNRKGKTPERGIPSWKPGPSASGTESGQPRASGYPAPRRKQVPSPLAQSTSAVNIQSEEQTSPKAPPEERQEEQITDVKDASVQGPISTDSSGSPIARFNELGSLKIPSDDNTHMSPSPSPSPIAQESSAQVGNPGTQNNQRLTRKLSKSRPSNASVQSLTSSSQSHLPSFETRKRSSLLTRFTKRFGFHRKAASQDVGPLRISNLPDREEPSRDDGSSVAISRLSNLAMQTDKSSQSNKFMGQKRVPPPSLTPQSTNGNEESSAAHTTPNVSSAPWPSSYAPQLPQVTLNERLDFSQYSEDMAFPQDKKDGDVRDSILSMEQGAWHIGKLTIANPDLQNSSDPDLSAHDDTDAQATPIANLSVLSAAERPVSIGIKGNARSPPHVPASTLITDNQRFSRVEDIRGTLPPSTDTDPRVSSHLPAANPRTPLRPDLVVQSLSSSPRQKIESPLPAVPLEIMEAAVEKSDPMKTPRASSSFVTPERTLHIQAAPQPEASSDTPPKPVDKDVMQLSSIGVSPHIGTHSRPNSTILFPKPNFAAPHSGSYSSAAGSSSSGTMSPSHAHVPRSHTYIVDVPLDLIRADADNASLSPGDRSAIPPRIPPKSHAIPEKPMPPMPPPSRAPSVRETTIFTSLFTVPSRTRRPSDSSPNDSSSHGHATGSTPRRNKHSRTTSYSPEKPAPDVHVRAGSESPDKIGRGERTVERHQREGYGNMEDSLLTRHQRDRYNEEMEYGLRKERRQDRDVGGRERDRERQDDRERNRDDEPTWHQHREREREAVSRREGERERISRREQERDKEERERERARQREREREQEEREKRKEREQDEKRKRREREREERERERRREEKKKEEREQEEREKRKRREREKEERERTEREMRERERTEREEREQEGREREREERERRGREERERERERSGGREKVKESDGVKGKEGRDREGRKEGGDRDQGWEKMREGEGEDTNDRRKAPRPDGEREGNANKRSNRHRFRDLEKGQNDLKDNMDQRRSRFPDPASQITRETEKYRLVPRSSSSSTDEDTERFDRSNLVKIFADGRDWEIVESSQLKQRTREDEERRRKTRAQNGNANNSTLAFPHRSSSSSDVESPQPVMRRHKDSKAGDRGSATWSYSLGNPTDSRASRIRVSSLELPPSPTSGPQASSSRLEESAFHLSNAPPASPEPYLPPRPRLRSAAQRPTSGIPSPAISQLKAKDAWERDRMWRGQSMAFGSRTTIVPANWEVPEVFPNPYNPYLSDPYHPQQPALHGSSYTSFMVQPSWDYPRFEPGQEPIEPFTLQKPANPLPAPPIVSDYQPPSD